MKYSLAQKQPFSDRVQYPEQGIAEIVACLVFIFHEPIEYQLKYDGQDFSFQIFHKLVIMRLSNSFWIVIIRYLISFRNPFRRLLFFTRKKRFLKVNPEGENFGNCHTLLYKDGLFFFFIPDSPKIPHLNVYIMKSNYPEKSLYSLTDQAVWMRFLEGNQKALGVLYHRYYRLMRLRAYRLLKNWEDSQDLVQEVFDKLMQLADQHAHDGLSIHDLKAWLYGWVDKLVMNYQKKINNRSRIIREKVAPDLPKYSYPEELTQEELMKAITSLPNPVFQIILTLDFMGYTNTEIAQILKKTRPWVNRNRYRARRALSSRYNS